MVHTWSRQGGLGLAWPLEIAMGRCSCQHGSAEEVEAQACREGLMLAAEWTPKPTILESDCSTVIRYLENPKSQRTPYGFIIQEAVEASRKLPKVVFQHIGRESNV